MSRDDPVMAITAGTRTAAELLGLSDRLGTLTAGKLADIVVCDGDPLTDIEVLGDPDNITTVIKEGAILKTHG